MKLYVVIRESWFGRTNVPSVIHESPAQAQAEASRLALANPGVTFHVASWTVDASIVAEPPPPPQPVLRITDHENPEVPF